jgi:predicted ATPase/signal transduction histidine kinase
MTMLIAGYQVQEKIYESRNSLVYRAHQKTENRPVVLKVLKQDYPPPKKIAAFKREFELTCSLQGEGIIRAYNLTADQNRLVMVLEDCGGVSLAQALQTKRLPLAELLPLAVQVADIVKQVHDQHVIHKDVNPSNIVWNPATGQLKLIDFCVATRLTRENPVLLYPTLVEGTLAYMSPEQTGRMNRAVDYRTDLYSLGVTLYELLTGQLPFSAADALAFVHAHIAQQPTPPHEIIPAIPRSLSDIVMKLLAKNTDDRYQSAYGLKADLEECLRQWQAARRVEFFPLGQHDVVDSFRLPQKLYGREQDVNILLTAFARVSQGASEMLLVSGQAGVGKTTLVHEVCRPITQEGGYFISGKFDQFQKDMPHAPLVQAFRSLLRQILTEREEQIVVWRNALIAALGSTLPVVIDIVPEVELIVGPQPVSPPLPPAEAQKRFYLALQNFVRVFAGSGHPLVIFLDDLQWADVASLDLLRLLLTAPENRYLLVICAYRDSEVTGAHPVQLTLDDIHKEGGSVSHIGLGPLSLRDTQQLIGDMFACTPGQAKPLAELMLAKTAGNPFFLNELLKSLYTAGLITFDVQHRGWRWDIARIRAQNITNNVIELMARKMQGLGGEAQGALKLAACLGNQFDLRILAAVCGQPLTKTAANLWPTLVEGLIVPLSDAYRLADLEVQGLADEAAIECKFAHDRIQYAAYALIPEADRPFVHRQIGQCLLRGMGPDERERKVFDLLNHLNMGRGLIQLHAELGELAALNLMAGRKAKAAAAYKAAHTYLQTGLELLGEEGWTRWYELTLALHEEAAEAAYLGGDYVQMDELTKVVLQHAKTLLDKVKVYECSIEASYAEQSRIKEGIRIGLEVLELLGIQLPEKPTPADIWCGLEETRLTLAGKDIEDLINLPPMTDPYKLATIRILMRLFSPAFVGSPELFALINCSAVNLSVKYGNTPLSARAYAAYGLIVCGGVGDIDTGYRFGKLALHMLERFNAKDIEASAILMVNVFVRHWKEHIKETLRPLLEAYKSGLETGAVEWAALAAFSYTFQAYWIGRELTELEGEMRKYGTAIDELKQDTILHLNSLFRQAVLNLMGRADNPRQLNGESYDEEMRLPLLLEANNVNALCMVYLHKLVLCYLLQDYPQAAVHALITEKYLPGTQGTPAVPIFHYYDSLVRLALFPDTSESGRRDLLGKVAANQEKMQNWAQHAPMNYLHKFYLVEAERARVLGNDHDAREYYDQAIDLAREHGYVNEEAVANELAAKFYLARGQERIAQHYLHDAHYAYTRWGALAKVKDLEACYPQFLTPIASNALPVTRGTFASGTGQRLSHAFDLTSVLKASQAISGEIHREKLLSTLMGIVLENAGAQRGLLLLEKEGHLRVVAEQTIGQIETAKLLSLPVETYEELPLAIIHYVARTKEPLTLNDATQEDLFRTDPYITTKTPKSILCIPLLSQNRLLGLIYLENNLATGAFTPDRLEIVNLLSAQAAISIENADLYWSLEANKEQLENYSKTLERKVEQRTHELQDRNLALELANEQVREANRRKSQFLAGMSHELRTPMNAIIGFTRLVLRRTGDLLPERQRDNLVKVIESANQLLNLINQLLDLSRLEAGRMQVHPEWFDVRRLILACCEMVSPLVKSGVHLQQEIAGTVGEMYTDEEGLRHVVLNLLSNAIKFTDSGEVVVRAWVNNGEVNGDASLGIAVSDTGIGIPADALDTIFEEFQQVEGGIQKREGTGLGLPIAKRWVELLGGSIMVESELEKGSTFTVIVPVPYRKP